MSNHVPFHSTSAESLTCAHVTALLIDYVLGELDATTRGTFEQHLQGCQECLAFLATYQKTLSVVGAVRYEEVPLALLVRVQQFLHASLAVKAFPSPPPQQATGNHSLPGSNGVRQHPPLLKGDRSC